MDKNANNPKVLLVIESSRPNGRDFLQGICRYVDEHSPWLFHFGEPGPFYRNEQAAAEVQSAAWFPRWTPSGVITCRPDLTQPYLSAGIPSILISECMNGGGNLPRVLLDHEGIGTMAAQEFLNGRYRLFGYCGFDEYSWSARRGDSFTRFLEARGFGVFRYPRSGSDGGRHWEKERLELGRWLRELPKPIGIFACNDDRGRDVIEVCGLEGIRVPEEAAVLGVDSDPMICDFCTPPLSSIRLDAQAAGYQAAAALDEMMQGRSPETQVILVRPLKVENRPSTDTMAVGDPEVKQAVRYIRQNSGQLIQVSDVVKAVGAPRRRLQMKFSEILGRSIRDEIQRACTERISQLLIQTDWPIKQIAMKFGYNGHSHLSRFFRKQTGLSPTEYRRLYRRGRRETMDQGYSRNSSQKRESSHVE